MGFLKDLFSQGSNNLVSTVGDVIDKITTTKEEKMQLDLEMKKAEMQYQVDLKKLTIEEKQIMYGEMESARRREVDVLSSQYSTKLAKNVSPYLAIGTTILTFTLFGILIGFNDKIKTEAKDIILYILGVLSAIITQIFSYYFGSSMGSVDKGLTIDKLLQK
jgi:hypothetical protein